MAASDLFGQEVYSTAQSGKEVNDAYRKVLETEYYKTKDSADVSFADREEARKEIEYNKIANLEQAKGVLDESTMKEEMLLLELNVDAMSSPEAGGLDSPEFKDGHEDFSVFSDLNIDKTLKTDTASMVARTFRQIAYDKGGAKELFAKVTELVNGNRDKVPTYKQPLEMVKVLWKRLQYLGFAIKRNEAGVIEPMKEDIPTIKDFLRALMTFQGFIQTPATSIRANFTPSKVDGVVGPLTLEQLLWMQKPIAMPTKAEEVPPSTTPLDTKVDSPIVMTESIQVPTPTMVPSSVDVQTIVPAIDQPMPTLSEDIATPALGFDVQQYIGSQRKESWPTMSAGSSLETRVTKTITDYITEHSLSPEDAEKFTNRFMQTAAALEKDGEVSNGARASYMDDLTETGVITVLDDEIYAKIEKEFVNTVKKSREANRKKNEQTGTVTAAMRRKVRARNRVQNPTGVWAALACKGNGPSVGNRFSTSGKSKIFKAYSMSDFYEKASDAVEIIEKAKVDPEYLKKAQESLKKESEDE